ncbi:hypothetical protein [Chitinolyticbacter albus]|uniref:hypothetical protein n=1 Tax=Chitinolyticbacter albus TaxID=2961951 RepID=UPI00210EEF49|nr:hypothetical protein [Chitinolyticbacter albus]
MKNMQGHGDPYRNMVEIFFGSPNPPYIYNDVAHKKRYLEKFFLSHSRSGIRFRKDLGLIEYYYPFEIQRDDGFVIRGDDSAYTIDDATEPPVGFVAWPVVICSSAHKPDDQCAAAFSISAELQGFYRFQFRYLNDFRRLHLHVIGKISELQER